MTCDQVLDLSGLSGIVDYAPEELVVTLRAGTPMREVEALLAQRNQMLAFEPPDLGPLARPGSGAGHPGRRGDGQPRRPAPPVGRRGARPPAGLQRRQRPRRGLQVGRQGDEERHRLRPLQASGRLVGHAGRARRGVGKGAARARPDAHAGAASAFPTRRRSRRCAPPWAARTTFPAPPMSMAGRPCASKAWRPRSRRASKGCAICWQDAAQRWRNSARSKAATFWRDVRDVAPLVECARRCRLEDLLPAYRRSRHRRAHQGPTAVGEGLLRLVGRPGLAGLAGKRRCRSCHRARALGPTGGHATLIRAPETVRADVPVFHPQPPALAALALRVKESFDPKGLFNPGRMG